MLTKLWICLTCSSQEALSDIILSIPHRGSVYEMDEPTKCHRNEKKEAFMKLIDGKSAKEMEMPLKSMKCNDTF